MEIHEAYSEIAELYRIAKCDYNLSTDPINLKTFDYEMGKK